MNFSQIYELSRLQEALRIQSGRQILELILDDDETLKRAARLNKFPSFYDKDACNQIQTVIDNLNNLDNVNITQAILLILRKSTDLKVFNEILSNMDAIYYYSTASVNRKIFRSTQYRAMNEEPYSKELWDSFVEFAKEQGEYVSKPNKNIDRYDKHCLYKDSNWELYYTTDYETAKHLAGGLKQFEYKDMSLTKARWCTAVDSTEGEMAFSRYTKDNGAYIIRHFDSGECDEVYQLCYGSDWVEFKDKSDACPESWGDSYGYSNTDETFGLLFNDCPDELLDKVKCNKNGKTLLDYKVAVKSLNKTFKDLPPNILDKDLEFILNREKTAKGQVIITDRQDLLPSDTDIFISNNNLIIDQYLYQNLPNLENIELENGIRIIDSYAFADCGKLNTVIIPETVEEMGIRAFSLDEIDTLIFKPNRIECSQHPYNEDETDELNEISAMVSIFQFAKIHTLKTNNKNIANFYKKYVGINVESL